MSDPQPMPIRLDKAAVASSPLRGRLVFVIDPLQRADRLVAELRDRPGVVVPHAPLNVFGRGLHLVFGNYLSARHVGGGIAALTDDAGFLRATRRLADSLYQPLIGDDNSVLVDASPSNAEMPQVIDGLYPDAVLVVVDDNDATRLLQGSNVARGHDAVAVLERVAPTGPPAGAVGTGPGLPGAPIFVVGCPRSGTTWLQNLLAAHPDAAGPAKESAIFVALRGLLDNDVVVAALGRPAVVAALRGYAEGLFGEWLGAHAPGAARFLEKTPMHARHLSVVAELFPEAFVVGIHRDGRDVVRSMLEVEAGLDEAAEAARGWAQITRAVADFAARSPQARDERYERLLQDPVGRVVPILEWLGLRPTDAVIAEVRRRAPERVSQYNTTGPVGPGKWRELAPDDLAAVYREAGDRLVELGYVTEAELPFTRRRFGLGPIRRRVRRR